MLQSLLKANAYDLALQTFVEIMQDPATTKRTKRAAAASLTAAYGRMMPSGAQVQVDASQYGLSMADLLALAQGRPEVPNSGPVVIPELQGDGSDGVPAFTATQRDDSRSSEPGTTDDDDPLLDLTEGSPSSSESEAAADALSGDQGKEDPTEGLADTASSEGAA